MEELENIVVPSPICTLRDTNCVVELVALFKTTTLVAHRYQSHISLCLWIYLMIQLSVRISPDGFIEWMK